MTETSVLHQAGAEIVSLRADNDRLRSELADAHVINHEFDDKLVAARAELATLRLYADEVTRDSNRELADAKAALTRYGDQGAFQALRDGADRAERAEAELKVMREVLEDLRAILFDNAWMTWVERIDAALAPSPAGRRGVDGL